MILRKETTNDNTLDNNIDRTMNMLSKVRTGVDMRDDAYTSMINKELTDFYTPNEIFKSIFKVYQFINLKDIVSNDKYYSSIKDINVIRLVEILVNIINNNKIDNKVEVFRELALSSDTYTYNYRDEHHSYALPSMYITDLKNNLLPNKDYNLGNNIDKIVSSIGYINSILFIDIVKYIITD